MKYKNLLRSIGVMFCSIATMIFISGSMLLIGTSPAFSADSAAEHQGGTLHLVARSAAGTIDPHINYTFQYWQIFPFLYDGLVTFKKVSGADGLQVTPDLATAIPEPQDGGTTYTFKLRKGVHFSNGKEVTVNDVVASMQRIFKVSGPTSGTFYDVIVGADKCLKSPSTCTLDGGVVGDPQAGTITFHLTRPDATFLYKLAIPHAAILPADAPAKDVGTLPIPGTGPYMIKSYDPTKKLDMVRNPYFEEWSKIAQPAGYADEILYRFGLTVESQVTAVENGDADWMFDRPPMDRLQEIGTRFRDQAHVHNLTAMWYAPMNTNIPPFNNIKARQAVNYAVDRGAIVKLFGGSLLAAPACQILPPGFPGYEPYCPYTKNPGTKWSAPDMAKAKALVAESGTAGQKVTIVVENTSIAKSIGVYLQGVLNDLGYKASVRTISPNIQFTYIQNTDNKVQISVSQWYSDFPAPSNFLHLLFSCASFHPGSDSSVNISGFCTKELDAQMEKAMRLAVTDREAANKIWAEIDREYTDKAPVAVLFTPKRLDFVSKRLGNFVFSPQLRGLISQFWVK